MNKAFLLGRLAKDPDMRETSKGTKVTSFTIAVNKRVKECEERTADFIFCKAFGKTAEFINNYFKKGQQVAVTGRISTGSYEKDGQKIYTMEVIVEETFFADSKREGNAGNVEVANTGVTNGGYLTPEQLAALEDELPF
jgi:single-strand DNA-binding protein